MGLLFWLGAALIAFAIARSISQGKRSRWSELIVAVLTSLAAGLAATALDFGGTDEAAPWAIAFAFFTASAAIALFRLERWSR